MPIPRPIRSAVMAALVLTASAVVTSQSPQTAVSSSSLSASRLTALLEATSSNIDWMPGEVLVKFREGVTPVQQQSVLRVLRVDDPPPSVRWIGGDTMLVTGLQDEDPRRAADALGRQPEVAFAEPNYINHLFSTPNDPGYPSQWNMDLINMPPAWEINHAAGTGVTVAILDSGFTTIQGNFLFRIWNGTAFATFAVPFARVSDFDNARVQTGVEFTPTGDWRLSTGQIALFDTVGHGTHIAGTIAQQTNNGVGFAGIANGATIMPVKVCYGPWDLQLYAGVVGLAGRVRGDEGGCNVADVATGIRYAVDHGAKVINMSLGAPAASQVELDALRYATQNGVFVSIASGNNALEGNPTIYPAAFAPQLDGVVAVGAITRNKVRAVYSSFGSYVEVVAPGGTAVGSPADDIWQVVPDPGGLSVRLLAPSFASYIPGNGAGTSMAAPHVAGVAALLYSQGITNAAAIEAALKRFVVDLGPAGRDDQYGYGLIDARAALRGFGVAR